MAAPEFDAGPVAVRRIEPLAASASRRSISALTALRASASVAPSVTTAINSRESAGENPATSRRCIMSARAGARCFRFDHATPASSRCIIAFIATISRIRSAATPSVSLVSLAILARGRGAPVSALAASAVTSIPFPNGRLLTINASSPSACLTFCSTSREVLPTNFCGAIIYSRLRT